MGKVPGHHNFDKLIAASAYFTTVPSLLRPLQVPLVRPGGLAKLVVTIPLEGHCVVGSALIMAMIPSLGVESLLIQASKDRSSYNFRIPVSSQVIGS